ncbi:MAG TPA: 50S ribosomal protein L25 [Acidimicrobiales bacterium]|nr:50S ribosomal protein L25 [Acidimicrobiales bacterium]
MPEISVIAEPRPQRGTSNSRRLRREGKIPGVVYGHGTDPVAVAVQARSLRSALTTDAGLNALLDLKVGESSHLVVTRELQRHPVKGTVSHVDFLVVRRDEVIAAEVPLVLVGEAVEVGHGDGRVEQQLFTLPVKAIPSNIPTSVDVDISELTIGGSIKVSDLNLGQGVSADIDPESSIVVGQPPRKGTGAEGEEGAEGEAPASASASSDVASGSES